MARNLTANLRELRREFDRATKLPVELVASSLAKHAWADACERSGFSSFSPHLETLIGIAREKANRWGYAGEPYDALLDGFERATAVASMFDAMRSAVRKIAAPTVENSAHHAPTLPAGPYPVAAQQNFNARVVEAIGFDFKAGRIDTTTHPFCTTLGAGRRSSYDPLHGMNREQRLHIIPGACPRKTCHPWNRNNDLSVWREAVIPP